MWLTISNVMMATMQLRLTSLDLRRCNVSDLGLLSQLRQLRLLVMDQSYDPQALPQISPTPVTVLRDDAGYLGCSFKHSNLKHMCDRHASRANSGNASALQLISDLE